MSMEFVSYMARRAGMVLAALPTALFSAVASAEPGGTPVDVAQAARHLEMITRGGQGLLPPGTLFGDGFPPAANIAGEVAPKLDLAQAAHMTAAGQTPWEAYLIADGAIVLAGFFLVSGICMARSAYVARQAAKISLALERRFSDAHWDGTVTDGLVSWTLKSQGGGGGWPTPYSKTLIFCPEYVTHKGFVDQGVPVGHEVPLTLVPPIDISLISALREGGQRIEVLAEPLLVTPQDYPKGVIAARRYRNMGDAAMRRALQTSLTDPSSFRDMTVIGYGGNGCYQAVQSLLSLPPQLRSRVKRLILISPVTEYARGGHQVGIRGLWATFAGSTIKQKGLPWIPYASQHLRAEARLPIQIPTVTEAVLGQRIATLRKMCAGGRLQGVLEGTEVTIILPEQDEIVGTNGIVKNSDRLNGGFLGRFGQRDDRLGVYLVPGTHLVFSGRDAGLHRTCQVVHEAYRPRSRGFGEDRRARREATFRVA